jgi:hypothetical protein
MLQPNSAHPMNPAQQELAGRNATGVNQLLDANGKPISNNAVYKVEYENGSNAAFKPQAGEGPSVIDPANFGDTPKAVRQQGYYTVDQVLGADHVPTSTVMDHPDLGTGSTVDWRPHSSVTDLSGFSKTDIQVAAARDYISGNVDNHLGNIGNAGGKPVCYDGGETFPVKPDGMRNEFVANTVGEAFTPDALKAVHSIDPAAMRQTLVGDGLSPQQVEGAMQRYNEIMQNDKITGESWTSQGGYIVNSAFTKVISAPVK